MISRDNLLKNVRSYSPREIAEAIQNNVVTFYDLKKQSKGAFSPLLQKQVKDILAGNVVNEVEVTTDIDNIDVSPTEEKNDDNTMIGKVNDSYVSPIDAESDTEHFYDLSDIVDPSYSIGIDNKGMFLRPFSFKGRIRRLEYFITLLIASLINIIITILSEYLAYNTSIEYESYIVLIILIFIPFMWFAFAQGAKRCHDLGNSGFFQIIPFYGLWMLFQDGNQGDNKYGNSPK